MNQQKTNTPPQKSKRSVLLISLIVFGAIVLFLVGILVISLLFKEEDNNGIDPNIIPIEREVLSVSGTVFRGDTPQNGAKISLQSGNAEVASTLTDSAGNFLLNNVKDGIYSLVCTCNGSVLTKMVVTEGKSVVCTFQFPENSTAKIYATVKIANDFTPAVSVNGLDSEVLAKVGAGKTVRLQFTAESLTEEALPVADKTAISAISGELEMHYYAFGITAQTNEETPWEISETSTVLEVALPYDSSKDIGTYLFRCHGGTATRLTELQARPSENFADGTFFVTSNTVFIYTNAFSTYAVGSAKVGYTVKGNDMLKYGSTAVVNLKNNAISMLYEHDADSTNNAKIDLYLVGENGNLQIAQSGQIPPGNKLEDMTLKKGVKNLPAPGSYQGLMKIQYLDAEGAPAGANLEIPVTVTLTE